jgi:hypothetical protein
VIKEFNRVVKYKIYIQKSVVSRVSYTSKTKETILLTIASKRTNLRITLTKCVNIENCTALKARCSGSSYKPNTWEVEAERSRV